MCHYLVYRQKVGSRHPDPQIDDDRLMNIVNDWTSVPLLKLFLSSVDRYTMDESDRVRDLTRSDLSDEGDGSERKPLAGPI